MVVVELAIFIAFYLAWTIGVQSMGTTIGITIGSGVLNLRKSVIVGGFFAVLGIFFFAPKIIETVGEGLINFDLIGVIAVLGTAGILATIFAYRHIPTSITYLIIGGVAGYSLGAGVPFNTKLYFIVLGSLFISPLVAIVLGYVVYRWMYLARIGKIRSARDRERYETAYMVPGIVGLALLAAVLGADAVGVVVSVLEQSQSTLFLSVLGAGGVLLGLFTWSYKVARTSGIQITELSPTRGFAANLSGGLVTAAFLAFGIPVSISQTLIGAIVGVGYSRGKIEYTTIKEILKFWAIGLPAAFVITYVLGALL